MPSSSSSSSSCHHHWILLLLVGISSSLFFQSQAFFLPCPQQALHKTVSKTRHAAAAATSGSYNMDQSEFARAELARKQQEYDAELKERVKDQVKQSVASGGVAASAPSLASLPLIAYLDGEGKISSSGVDPKVKASVYAVYDEAGKVCFIGVSRSVAQSLRLHLARMPEQTYSFKVFHITKPSRVLLEITRDGWIEELGYKPEGNDDGPKQQLWESALDVKPLMTAEDHAAMETARIKQRSEENAMKKVTRRFEEAKIQVLNARGVTESLRFDPKLKGKGLLDLYLDKQPDSAVPT